MKEEPEITTPNDFYNEMHRISSEISRENPVLAHQLGIGLMCDLLTRLGFFDGVSVFDEMESRFDGF